jgi:preprotein translocase, YajC subunit
MNSLFLMDTAAQSPEGMNPMIMLAVYGLFFAALYFFFFRPQKKKKKKEESMRKNAQIGDEITTIGGISGRIVAVKEEVDSVILETGTDKSKIRVKRWAIGSVDTVHEDD